MSKDQIQAPIYVNLNGMYAIPVDGEKPKSGSITGDLRLAGLDAFLVSLNSALKVKSTATPEQCGGSLVDALKVIIDNCNATKRKNSGVALVINQKLSPETNELSYSFNVITTTKTKST